MGCSQLCPSQSRKENRTLPSNFTGTTYFAPLEHFDLQLLLRGFANSLSIVISFLASVALFDYRVTPAFLVGACLVLGATWV